MKSAPVPFRSINRVLIAKLRHHGDVLLSAPVFSVLKNAFSHLEIDAYIYRETLPMLEGHPCIANFLLQDKEWKKLPLLQRYYRELKLLGKIRRKKYDLVINLTEGDRGAIAAKASKAPYCIGFDPQGGGMKGKKKCYSHIVKHTPRPRHAVEKNLDVLRCLGLFPSLEEREIFFHIPKNAYATVEALLPENFVLLHPVSRWMYKALPVETMAVVARAVQSRGKSIVLTGSSHPAEMEMNRQIALQVPGAINLSGKLSLKELGAVIAMSCLLITVDSVPLHLASALNKPTVAIFGPTCDQNWGPYRNPLSRVVKLSMSCQPCYQPGCGGSGKSDCLERLVPAKILAAIHEVTEKCNSLHTK